MEIAEEKKVRVGVRCVLGGLVVVLVIAAFYCSLVADPHMTRIIPGWLGRWADNHTILRTAVPFCGMAILLGILKFRGDETQEESKRAFIVVIGMPSLFVTLCELAQIPLPKRSADIRDVAAGVIGAAVGGCSVWLLGRMAAILLKKPNSPRPSK